MTVHGEVMPDESWVLQDCRYWADGELVWAMDAMSVADFKRKTGANEVRRAEPYIWEMKPIWDEVEIP